MLFSFTQGLLSDQLAEIDHWREKIDRQGPRSRRWSGRLRRDLEAEVVAASTRMEGVGATVDEVRRVLVGDPPQEVAANDQQLISGYQEAMQYVLRRADDPAFRWDRELIISIHDRVLGGNFTAGAGRFRTRPAYVVANQNDELLFTTAEPEQIAGLIDRACQQLTESQSHPAIQSAWIHIATAAIHPFQDGNGRTARILASLAMCRGGFHLQPFHSLEEWWGNHPKAYYAAFECLGRTFNPDSDITPFIKTHVQAQLSQIRALDLREQTQRQVWTVLENIVESHKLPTRTTNALWDAFFGRSVTARYYRGFTDVSPATATNDLTNAKHTGLLQATGSTRDRQYFHGPKLITAIGSELNIADLPEDLRAARSIITAELAQRGKL